MQLRLTNLLIAVTAILALFSASCKKEFSPDEPFTTTYSPTIFISSQNQFVYALDPQNGNKKWEFNAKANVQGSPLLLGDYLYVAAENGTLYKLDAKRGTEVKKYEFFTQLLSTPVGEGDFVYLGTGNDTMYCIDVKGDTLE